MAPTTLHLLPEQAVALDALPTAACEQGYYWIDLTHDSFAADPERWRSLAAALTGVQLHDLHLQDAANLQHRSYFEGTADYDMLIFRKLATGEPAAPAQASRALVQELVTRPITFFVFDRLLLTIRNPQSRTVDQVRTRLLELRARRAGEPVALRLPQRPEELMLRLVNGMVDRYLDLRQPLTDQLDRWQRELLDPRRPFSDWAALLAARLELRKLESLSEEQTDALQELRDAYLESTPTAQQSDAYLIRLADVIEHVQRVLTHARRLEATVETAVQLHFSATAHRTNQVVRLLTVITAIFAPLTLIAGIWGMNFERIPLAQQPHGFGVVVGGMALLAVVMLLIFWARRFMSDSPSRTVRWWRRVWRR
ncbi:MAG: magnesium transporter CorA family protein [Betaproteobacteria bacterium]